MAQSDPSVPIRRSAEVRTPSERQLDVDDELVQRNRAARVDDEAADACDAAASLADTAASARDVAAMERDFEADIEMTRGPMTTASIRAQRDREAAARDREGGVNDRDRARQDRKTAKKGRERSLRDRDTARDVVANLRAQLDGAEGHAEVTSIVEHAQARIMQEAGVDATEALTILAIRTAQNREALNTMDLSIVADDDN